MPSLQFTFPSGRLLSFLVSVTIGGGLLLSSACGKVEPVECPVSSSEDQPGQQEDAGTVTTPARDACDALAIAQIAFAKTCKGYEPPRESLAEACRALTRLPGSTIGDDDLATCTKDILSGAHTCSVPTCIGYAGDFLFPGKESLWNSLRLPGKTEKAGTLANGAPCLADLQCAGAECQLDHRSFCGTCQSTKYLDQTCTGAGERCTNGTVCSGGVCILSGAKEGEPCGDENHCQSTLYCRTTSNGGVCEPKAVIGEACVPDGTGVPCVEQNSYCNFNTRRCTLLRTLGEACDEPLACALGLECSNETCVPVIAGGLDQTCQAGCAFDMPCIDGICRRPPGTGEPEGAPCDGQLCAAGLVCGEPCSDTECNAPPTACRRFHAGDPCTSGHECPDGMWCVHDYAQPGTCQLLNDIGDACDEGNPCQHHLICENGRCETASMALCQ